MQSTEEVLADSQHPEELTGSSKISVSHVESGRVPSEVKSASVKTNLDTPESSCDSKRTIFVVSLTMLGIIVIGGGIAVDVILTSSHNKASAPLSPLAPPPPLPTSMPPPPSAAPIRIPDSIRGMWSGNVSSSPMGPFHTDWNGNGGSSNVRR